MNSAWLGVATRPQLGMTLLVVLCGCMSDAHMEQVGKASVMQPAAAGGTARVEAQQPEPSMQPGPMQPEPSMQPGPMQSEPSMQPGPMQSEPSMQPGPMQPEPSMQPEPMQPSRGAPEPAVKDRAQCAGSVDKIMTGLDEIYGLAVTSSKVYVGTYTGVRVSGRNGGEAQRVVPKYVQRILADEQRLFWSDASLNLNVQTDGGASSEFLPTHGAIEGVSQDEDSIYAISDGYLVRVSKQTKAVTPLVQGESENALHWSGTAVDASHVYFVSYGSASSDLNLERVRKDGTGRELLANGLSELMEPVELLVDDKHVYAASLQQLVRVPLAGGKLEPLGAMGSRGLRPAIAQDKNCVYYADETRLMCASKADGSRQLVTTVAEGFVREVAAAGSDVYFGVYIDGPAFDAKSWVGRVVCQADMR